MEELGMKVREKLMRNQLSVKWLALQLRMRGVEVQYQHLSSALNGGRSGAVTSNWLNKSLQILAAYEEAAPAWQKEVI